MPRKVSDSNVPKAPATPTVDLRNLRPVEARARAFQGMFKVKPGQRAAVLANAPEVEKEIMKWITEVGHRFLKSVRLEDNGRSYASIELIKQEARR